MTGPGWLTGALAARLLAALGLALALYYPVGMALVHVIDDDPDLEISGAQLTAGQSRAVAMAAELIDREVNRHRWTANDPFFLPAAALDNMPNFQQGIISALARFAFELTDQIGRVRGSSQADPDLAEAAGLLQYSGTKWVFDLSVSLAPTATSEAQYRKARRSLLAYNRRLAAGEAVFERRGDNLLATLDRMALDLGSSSAVLDIRIREHGAALIDTRADDLFYNVKGQLYAYYLIIRELGADYGQVIAERQLEKAWGGLVDSLRAAAVLDPLVVINGDPEGLILPSHLAAQGFFLMRARTQLREITNILLK